MRRTARYWLTQAALLVGAPVVCADVVVRMARWQPMRWMKPHYSSTNLRPGEWAWWLTGLVWIAACVAAFGYGLWRLRPSSRD